MNDLTYERAQRLETTREASRRKHDRIVQDMAREEREAERLHDQEPGRWGDHASPRRMRRDIQREREEDRGY